MWHIEVDFGMDTFVAVKISLVDIIGWFSREFGELVPDEIRITRVYQ